MTPSEDLNSRLRGLRDEGPQRWSVPEAGWLAGWLTEVAAVLQALGVDAGALREFRSAAGDPNSPDALLGAGWRLVELGLEAWAVGPLARAEALRPGDLTTVSELGVALEAALVPGDVVRLYDAHPELLAADPLARYQYAHCAAMAGDVSPARRIARTIPAEHPDGAHLRETLEGLVARADAVGAHLPLDQQDLRGWHAVLTGGVLLSRAPADMDGMTGRFGALWDDPGSFAKVLERLRVALDVAGRRPNRVLVTGDRDDRVLAHAVAGRLEVPVVDAGGAGPEGLALLPLFSWATTTARLPAAVLEAVADPVRRHGILGFGYWLDFTATAWPAPDLVGVLAQHVQPAWGERMRMEPWPADLGDPDPARRPELVPVPADDRDPAVIGADAASWPAGEPGDEDDRAELVTVVAALGSVQRWSACHGGARSFYRPIGPVASAMFR